MTSPSNPDNYKPPPGYTKLKQEERLSLMVNLKKKLREKHSVDAKDTDTSKIHVYYICYDADNERIVQNIQKTLIYSSADLDNL